MQVRALPAQGQRADSAHYSDAFTAASPSWPSKVVTPASQASSTLRLLREHLLRRVLRVRAVVEDLAHDRVLHVDGEVHLAEKLCEVGAFLGIALARHGAHRRRAIIRAEIGVAAGEVGRASSLVFIGCGSQARKTIQSSRRPARSTCASIACSLEFDQLPVAETEIVGVDHLLDVLVRRRAGLDAVDRAVELLGVGGEVVEVLHAGVGDIVRHGEGEADAVEVGVDHHHVAGAISGSTKGVWAGIQLPRKASMSPVLQRLVGHRHGQRVDRLLVAERRRARRRAMALVEVMSVQPGSDMRSVLQLSGSAAKRGAGTGGAERDGCALEEAFHGWRVLSVVASKPVTTSAALSGSGPAPRGRRGPCGCACTALLASRNGWKSHGAGAPMRQRRGRPDAAAAGCPAPAGRARQGPSAARPRRGTRRPHPHARDRRRGSSRSSGSAARS